MCIDRYNRLQVENRQSLYLHCMHCSTGQSSKIFFALYAFYTSIDEMSCKSSSYTFPTVINVTQNLTCSLTKYATTRCNRANVGLRLMYADDVMIISRSRRAFQGLFDVVQLELRWINLELNFVRCCAMLIGHCYDKMCSPVKTLVCYHIAWVDVLSCVWVHVVKATKC
jgi:hypothetical protein